MVLNKKITAIAVCMLIVSSLLFNSGCSFISSDIGSLMNPQGGEETILYIDGKATELSAPSRISSKYKSYDELCKLIYSAAYTSLCAGYNEFKLTGVDYKKVFSTYGDVLSAFMLDFPEFFWLSGNVEINAEYVEGSNIGSVKIAFGVYEHWKSSDIASARAEFADALKSLVHEASALKDDYEKVKFVHDHIIKNTEYDYDSYNAGKDIDAESNAMVNSAYGALVAGRAMCGGYARAFKLVMNKLGIEAAYITGDVDSGPHAWNSVKLGDDHYFIDLTWDDTDGEPCETIYYYFCVTAEDINKTHRSDAEFSDIKADSSEYNYYTKEGLFLEKYDFDALKAIWSSVTRNETLSVRFATNAEMDKAYEDLIRSGNISKLEVGIPNDFQYMISNDYNILTIVLD